MMKMKNGVGAGFAIVLLFSSVAHAVDDAVPASQVVGGLWQPHKARVSYFGITSKFTCSGLEDHVREILVYLGARKDAKVRASGCPGAQDEPSSTAWIDATFSTLAPTDDPQARDLVKAYWTIREVGPRRPFFMGDGDCELVEQLQKTIRESFALKDVEYRTDCVPHEISLNGFKVKAQALLALPEARSASANPGN